MSASTTYARRTQTSKLSTSQNPLSVFLRRTYLAEVHRELLSLGKLASTSNFEACRAAGEKSERYISLALGLGVETNGRAKHDLICTDGQPFELKADFRAEATGNFAFQLAKNSKLADNAASLKAGCGLIGFYLPQSDVLHVFELSKLVAELDEKRSQFRGFTKVQIGKYEKYPSEFLIVPVPSATAFNSHLGAIHPQSLSAPAEFASLISRQVGAA